MNIDNRNRLILLAALSLTLAACGGGGSSGAATTEPGSETVSGPLPDAGNGSGSGNGNGGGTAPVTEDAIDKYMATFVQECVAEPRVKDAATGAPLFVKETIKATVKESATKALLEYRHALYTTSDCSGQATNIDMSGKENWLSIDGSVDVAEGKADKVTFSEGNKIPGVTAGGTITVNGLSFTNGYTAPTTVKTLLLLKGNDLFMGDRSKPTDAQGYFAALQATATFKKP